MDKKVNHQDEKIDFRDIYKPAQATLKMSNL